MIELRPASLLDPGRPPSLHLHRSWPEQCVSLRPLSKPVPFHRLSNLSTSFCAIHEDTFATPATRSLIRPLNHPQSFGKGQTQACLLEHLGWHATSLRILKSSIYHQRKSSGGSELIAAGRYGCCLLPARGMILVRSRSLPYTAADAEFLCLPCRPSTLTVKSTSFISSSCGALGRVLSER